MKNKNPSLKNTPNGTIYFLSAKKFVCLKIWNTEKQIVFFFKHETSYINLTLFVPAVYIMEGLGVFDSACSFHIAT